MRAGAARFDITPPLPVDVLGYVRRDVAPRRVADPLLATGVVLEGSEATLAIIAADLANLAPGFADEVRGRVADALDVPAANILLNSSHTHAAPWPGAKHKLGGEVDGWTQRERDYWASLPDAFASVAVQARASAREARISGAVGHAPGLAVNRRERASDGRTILGWNPDEFVDDSVPTLRIDDLDGEAIATLVGFGCHPVVVGPDVPAIGSDFVGPLRRQVEDLRGGVAVFLQGAAGNVLPLEAFFDHAGPEVAMGERLGLEAAHAVADSEPRAMQVDKVDFGSVTPISLYRRSRASQQPDQIVATARTTLRLPLLSAPSEDELEAELLERQAEMQARLEAGDGRQLTNPISYHLDWLRWMLDNTRRGVIPTEVEGEVWAARIGDCAVVGTPGELFGEIGAAVRAASPAQTTVFAGYCGGVLGYVATPAEYPHGGYEPAVSHRGYGHPAPFAPEVAGLLEAASIDLLRGLFEGRERRQVAGSTPRE
jgi:neutral ceramidase